MGVAPCGPLARCGPFCKEKRKSLSLGPCGPLRNYFCLASNQLSIV